MLLLAGLCVAAWGATTWKLALKSGTVMVCDAPPIVIQGAYLFRGIDGKDASVAAAEVDVEETGRLNKVDPKPRWRETSRTNNKLPVTADIVALSDSNFDSEVLRSEVPVLVDFWAAWCKPCKRMEPAMAAVAERYAGKVTVGRLDVDENEATTRRYGIGSYPTLLLFREGAVVGRITGAVGEDAIARMLDARR